MSFLLQHRKKRKTHNRAKEELPSLRQKLCRKTRDVSGIITRQASSYQGEKQAKLSKDMAEVTNRMQVLRHNEVITHTM